MMEFVKNVMIVPARTVGNTTRLIDAYIQELFINGRIVVKDHYPSEAADKNLFDRIVKRLTSEHRLDIRREQFIISKAKLTIIYDNK